MSRWTPDVTLVTAIVDIGRETLPGGFGRPFDFYREHLKALHGLDVPMVVYADQSFSLPDSRSGRKLVPVDRHSLEEFAHFDKIQRIRKSPTWLKGARWLADSPQAGLPHYNPLVMSKLLWLADQARANPFGTRYFAWIDGGIASTVPLDLLGKSLCAASLP